MTRKQVRHYNLPGHAHELTFSCYHKRPFLAKDRTRQWLVQAMDQARRKREFDLLAFVIMPEHVHLIVQPRGNDYDVAWYLKSIKQSVSKKAGNWLKAHYPDQHEVLCNAAGQFCFWQPGGGYDRNIKTPVVLNKMIAYIHHNPVRRGLVQRAADWKWSSAGWYENETGVLAMDALPG
ncbi:MAG: transposase [Thermodesulfobacteriota bacterium]|nr:transposase [Thermodesulfobacteriota bacterium]